MSGELQSRILCGYVTVKAGAVQRDGKSNVQFSDGSSEEDIDVIVCATGYDYQSVQSQLGQLFFFYNTRYKEHSLSYRKVGCYM